MADFVIKGLEFKKVENNTIRLLPGGRVFVPNYPGGEEHRYGCVGKCFPYEVCKSDKEKIIRWNYCRNLNDINRAIQLKHSEDWDGITADNIINITWDGSSECYVVFWRV